MQLDCFMGYFAVLTDPRRRHLRLYSLQEILFSTLCSILSGCNDFVEISLFSKERLEYLRRYYPFEHGIPSDDTYRRVFSRIDPVLFHACFAKWAQSMCEHVNGVLAIDGKTLRHSFDGDGKPTHIVSAFARDCNLVLAQCAVDEKSNEITAIPVLLRLLDLKGLTVTLDAMGTQRAIAEQILEQGGDYIMSLKGNQETLHSDVSMVFDDPKTEGLEHFETVEKDHGRLETRTLRVKRDSDGGLDWLKETQQWPGLRMIIEIERAREVRSRGKVKISNEKSFYISSLDDSIEVIAQKIRHHWGIENTVHWTLDMTFQEDMNRSRIGHSAENFATARHVALNMVQKTKCPKTSIKNTRKKAGWSTQALDDILQKNGCQPTIADA
jgi:predicted transposase YbfD/YdcC